MSQRAPDRVLTVSSGMTQVSFAPPTGRARGATFTRADGRPGTRLVSLYQAGKAGVGGRGRPRLPTPRDAGPASLLLPTRVSAAFQEGMEMIAVFHSEEPGTVNVTFGGRA